MKEMPEFELQFSPESYPQDFGQRSEILSMELMEELPFVEKVEKFLSFEQERKEEAPADYLVWVKGWEGPIGVQFSVENPQTKEEREKFEKKVKKYPLQITRQGKLIWVVFVEGQGKVYADAFEAYLRRESKEPPVNFIPLSEKANLTHQFIARTVEALPHPREKKKFLFDVESQIQKGPPH